MSNLDKNFSPKNIQNWDSIWENAGIYKFGGQKSSYCIMLPPPNVTGRLHMGHAFQDTIMDLLCRYNRQLGKSVLWQPGVDHAGIATQMIVERQIIQSGSSLEKIGRKSFMEKAFAWSQYSRQAIESQMQRLGSSVDWSRKCFTLDDSRAHAVKTAFVKLYRDKLIYKKKVLVNWDPKLQTAISDLEVVKKSSNGSMWHIKYFSENHNDEYLIVATTRPETLFGDVAVAVHSEDKRYAKFIGTKVLIPFTNKPIPVIADNYVDPNFGTGCLKITPAHDFNDFEVSKRHNIDPVNIMNPNATLNQEVPVEYQGLTVLEARSLLVSNLEKNNLLDKVLPHELEIPVGERTGEVIEPMLTEQWFLNVTDMAKNAKAVVDNKELNIHPNNWVKIYNQWLENINDWCISRQLWWGHQIPAWYDNAGNTYVGFDVNEVRSYYKLKEDVFLQQDEDVLDTWFSSALWPMATLGWPEKTPEFEKFYSTDVLVTGFDIIFFWVARMVMFGIYFTGKIPFKNVYVHGLILDSYGQKMSKSKGNVIDPIDLLDGINLDDLIKKRCSNLMQESIKDEIIAKTKQEFPLGIPSYGADCLRFAFVQLALPTRELRFDKSKLDSSLHFCNKIWHAYRFALNNCINFTERDLDAVVHPINKWIINELFALNDKISVNLQNYRFDLYANEIYDFFWDKVCSWYLESTKTLLKNDNFMHETKVVLSYVMKNTLFILHPSMPFITEEIADAITNKSKLNWFENKLLAGLQAPKFIKYQLEIESLNKFFKIISTVRQLKANKQISIQTKINVTITELSKYLPQYKFYHDIITNLCGISKLSNKASENIEFVGTIDNIKIYFEDIKRKITTSELEEIKCRIIKYEKELLKNKALKNNDAFMSKAPKAVKDKILIKVSELETQIKQLQQDIL